MRLLWEAAELGALGVLVGLPLREAVSRRQVSNRALQARASTVRCWGCPPGSSATSMATVQRCHGPAALHRIIRAGSCGDIQSKFAPVAAWLHRREVSGEAGVSLPQHTDPCLEPVDLTFPSKHFGIRAKSASPVILSRFY